MASPRGKWSRSAAAPLLLHMPRNFAEHPFVTCVGSEDRPYRMHRAEFAYDTGYPGEPLPVIRIGAEFRPVSGTAGVEFDQIIADTGADTTALRRDDCQLLQLDPEQGIPAVMTGVGGGSANTLAFSFGSTWTATNMSANCTRISLVMNASWHDVLNSLDVLFRGPRGVVVFNP